MKTLLTLARLVKSTKKKQLTHLRRVKNAEMRYRGFFKKENLTQKRMLKQTKIKCEKLRFLRSQAKSKKQMNFARFACLKITGKLAVQNLKRANRFQKQHQMLSKVKETQAKHLNRLKQAEKNYENFAKSVRASQNAVKNRL